MAQAKPPARVRQSGPGDWVAPRVAEMKIRPFDEWFVRGNGVAPLQVIGRCSPSAYVVSVTGCGEVRLDGKVGRDREGTYAIVSCQQHLLPFGLALRVEVEAADSLGELACISCFELPDDLAAQLEVCNATRWYSVCFNAMGHVDGIATGCPRSLKTSPPCA